MPPDDAGVIEPEPWRREAAGDEPARVLERVPVMRAAGAERGDEADPEPPAGAQRADGFMAKGPQNSGRTFPPATRGSGGRPDRDPTPRLPHHPVRLIDGRRTVNHAPVGQAEPRAVPRAHDGPVLERPFAERTAHVRAALREREDVTVLADAC